MEKSHENRAIALAGIFQACKLVNDLAYQGEADEEEMQPLIHSIFDNDAQTIEDTYGGLAGLEQGLSLVIGLLNNPGKGNTTLTITRYSVSLIHLERQLRKTPKTGAKMIEDIDSAKRQIKFFGGMF
ncbi:MAG TPA: DUF489 family protein, partial [Gammaproteobacteria bacterium]|nr:DUF489 family protein [Gammaproteobacteria bacterium]